MKIIEPTLAAQKDQSVKDCVYSIEMLFNSSEEDSQNWSDVEDSEDEQDELKLSFREGMKRTASDEFCGDLKRIKFDNNVRDITNNLSSFQLELMQVERASVKRNEISKNLQKSSEIKR